MFHRRRRPLLAGAFLWLAACGVAPGPPTSDEVRESARDAHLLVVLLDAAAAGHFSYLGYERPTTPSIDRLAAESVVFEQAYASASATPLSVYSLFTSRNPLMHERELPEGEELAAVIVPAMPTLASRLAQRTPLRLGLTANRWIRPELGFDTGFAEFHSLADEIEGEGALGTVNAEQLTDRAIEWIDAQDGDTPWFAYLHYLEPHEPYAPPEPFASRFDPEVRGAVDGTRETLEPWRTRLPPDAVRRDTIARYDGNLAYVDHQVGRLLDHLERKGQLRRTVVVLVSDHGEAFWEHGVRGHGLHAYEEFVRVPLLLRVPGVAPVRVHEPVSLVDVLPTVMDLFGIALPPKAVVGHSLLPTFTADGPDHRPPVFVRNHKAGRWEYGVREGRYKFIHYFGAHGDEVFDLASDPGETSNGLRTEWAAQARVVDARLRGLLREWVESGSGVDDGALPTAGTDSLDARSREALRALGYFH